MAAQVKKSIKSVQPQFQFGLEEIWKDAQSLPRLSRIQILSHHFSAAWNSFLASPITTIVTTLTITLSLFLFATLMLVRANTVDYFQAPKQSLTLEVFLLDSATKEQKEALRAALTDFIGVKRVDYVSKDLALENFRVQLGDQSGMLEGIDGQNPLPESFVVRAGNALENAELFPKLAEAFESHEIVDIIQYQQGLVQKLERLALLLSRAGTLAIFFALILTAGIITSAIRLAVYARKTEIEIMELVGATDQFVRSPFLIEGFFQGLIGSALSVLILYLSYSGLRDFIDRAELIPFLDIEIHFLSPLSVVLIIVVGTSIGFFGSYLAVRHYEKES